MRSIKFSKIRVKIIVLSLCAVSAFEPLTAQQPTISAISPTPFFPGQESDKTLKQIAKIKVENRGTTTSLRLKLELADYETFITDFGVVDSGSHIFNVLVPDVKSATDMTFTLLNKEGRLLDGKHMTWQPQKKWKIYYAAISHHVLGFITYYQNIRRGVREEGIDLALEYYEETDSWSENDQFRWNIGTSEPLFRWMSKQKPEKIKELERRIHNTGRKNRVFNKEVGSMVLDEIKHHLDFLHPESIQWNPIQVLDKMGNGEDILYCPHLFGYTNYSREGYTKYVVHFTHSPVGKQKNISTLLGGVGLAVSSKSNYPYIATNFVESEIQEGVFTLNDGQPGNMIAWQNENNNALCGNFFKDTLSTIEKAYVRPKHTGWNEFQDQGCVLLHERILKNRPPSKIMNDLNELYKSIYCL